MIKTTIPSIFLILTACASNTDETLNTVREADESDNGEMVEPGSQSNNERLSELDELVERGLISEEEYQEARRRVLGI